ncbi:hypothetical protein HMPREF1376_02200 [Enterococcus faecium R446]|nr:hypothetical protein HMPREF1376_02200 [Enterococcus faecium R446]
MPNQMKNMRSYFCLAVLILDEEQLFHDLFLKVFLQFSSKE